MDSVYSRLVSGRRSRLEAPVHTLPTRRLLAAFASVVLVATVADAARSRYGSIAESKRRIPVADSVDVVVVGGSTGAVAAACGAARAGASVFLVTDRTYLGEDLCAHTRLWLEPGEKADAPLAKALFPRSGPVKPMHVKHELDKALEGAGARFLFGSYVTDVLRDAGGEPAGVVIANRSGRQAIEAKTIVDATDRAWIARMAGARFSEYPRGAQAFRRVVVGGKPRSGAGIVSVRTLEFKIENYDVVEYQLSIDMADGSWRSFANAEHVARDLTVHPAQVDDSETLFQVPPDNVFAEKNEDGRWMGGAHFPVDACRPVSVPHLYVLGGCASVSREAAESMLRPTEFVAAGERVGEAAARAAARRGRLAGVKLPGERVRSVARGEIGERLAGLRPTDTEDRTIESEARGLPVLGTYDVVVIGGGTGGAPAGIGAARGGAKTLVVEYQRGLGGVATVGLIGKYYYGNRVGFTSELDRALPGQNDSRYVVRKMEWLRHESREAGAEIWFGAIGCGAFVENGRVKGAIVATPEGRGVVLANTVVDSTGNADVAAAAGAECTYTGGKHMAVQGTGLPPRNLGKSYTNTDYTFADDTDVTDFWHLFVWAREKFGGAYDLGQLVDTRERRRIVGDHTITPMDIINERTYPDTIVRSYSNFDSHGYTVHDYFLIRPPDKVGMYVSVPYRVLLPKGLDGILVTGLAVSAHRDAMPVIRMQPDIQNQGYAAGRAGAMAAAGRTTVRKIDVKALQRHLVEIRVLPADTLSHEDSYPIPADKLKRAVASLSQSAGGIVVDDADGAPSFSVTSTGSWKSSHATRGYVGAGYTHCRDKGPTATFKPKLPGAGEYTVELRWTANSNRARRVPVSVRHAGGVARTTVDQTRKGGTWHELGTYQFRADGSESVVLATEGTEAGRYVIADAVRFSPPGAGGGMDVKHALALVLAHTDQTLPMLKAAHAGADAPAERLVYAHVLGMLGDPTGVDALVKRVASAPGWDSGWNYKGMGQFGPSISQLDSYIIALGRTGSPEAIAPVVRLIGMLDTSDDFSHHRAVAVACETLESAGPAPALHSLLSKPGMTGHHVHTSAEARKRYFKGGTENESRNRSLKELVVARALFRCGDKASLGKRILENYADDLRGHFSRHARAVLGGRQ